MQDAYILCYTRAMAIHFYDLPFYVFNNLSAHAVEFEGKLYPTTEHAYQAVKCLSEEGKEAIRLARSPLQAKNLANITYKSARDPHWEDKKVAVMEAILRAKLAQHAEARDALARSGDEPIVENSPVDYFWGEGKDGTGQNQLGKLWMKIRSELHEQKAIDA